jgi:putative ABC transport system permease protein
MMTRAEWEESLSLALANIATQKLRSFLTMLGIVIGIASVISVAAIINGLNRHVTDKIRQIGSHSFFITRFKAFTIDFERLPEEIRRRRHFTPEDAMAIRQMSPDVEKATPILTRAIFLGGENELRYANNHVEGSILRGGEPELADVLPVYTVKEGRFLTSEENLHAERVCVLGNAIADSLFGPIGPVDREVRLNGLPFRVIGVFEPQQGLFGGPGVDQFVIIPYRTFAKLYPEIEEVVIGVSVSDAALLGRAEDEVVDVLRRRRHVPAEKPNDFEVTSPDLLTDLWKQLTGAIVVLTFIIASIGLLVGGIGVMNIMLVSVTERTAEIGVRKAVGARRRDVLAQFLLEAVTLTSVGGLIGIAVGLLLSLGVATFFPSLPARVSLSWVVISAVISIGVGLFFGLYPAMKASKLQPVLCLRHE